MDQNKLRNNLTYFLSRPALIFLFRFGAYKWRYE